MKTFCDSTFYSFKIHTNLLSSDLEKIPLITRLKFLLFICIHMLFVGLLLSCVRLFCDLIVCSSPDSSVHGMFKARILEWVAISFSRGSFWSRDRTCFSCVSCTGRWILYHCAIWEATFPPHYSLFLIS